MRRKKILKTKTKKKKVSVLELAFERLLKNEGFKEFVREHRFDPTRLWRFDFANIEDKVAVEIEGGVWLRGRGGHTSPSGFKKDCEKYNRAAVLGWRVLRYTSIQDMGNFFVDYIAIMNSKNDL